MSSPFVYTPSQHYTSVSQPIEDFSPFIPDNSIYPTSPHYSPYHSPYHHPISLPGSPHASAAALGPSSPPATYLNVDQPYGRTRTTSWHGTTAPLSPFIPPTTYLPSVPDGGETAYTHTRRHSFSVSASKQRQAAFPPSWPAYSGSYPSPALMQIGLPPTPAIPVQIHPWINGQASSRKDIFFNMSPTTFVVHKRVAGQFLPVSPNELNSPATHPSVNQMKITIDRLPQWPITISYNPYADDGGLLTVPGAQPNSFPPLMIGDILSQIHSQMHKRISHADWDVLSKPDRDSIGIAFYRRCTGQPPVPGEPDWRSDGVHRVDFLVDHSVFLGLVPDGIDSYKLITARAR